MLHARVVVTQLSLLPSVRPGGAWAKDSQSPSICGLVGKVVANLFVEKNRSRKRK